MSEMKPKKMVRRSVAIALGIICIILIAGMVEIWLSYLVQDIEKDETINILHIEVFNKDSQISQLNLQMEDQNNSISSLSSQISQLNSNVTSLQNQVTIQQEELNDLRNVTVVSVDDIALNASAWLNKTVIVEGKLSGPFGFLPEDMPPYNYVLFRYNETSEASTVFAGLSWNSSDLYDLANVVVVGVVRFVRGGEFIRSGFLIEAESIILLQ
jgi:uncharacterized coiled-coil protein SlyX